MMLFLFYQLKYVEINMKQRLRVELTKPETCDDFILMVSNNVVQLFTEFKNQKMLLLTAAKKIIIVIVVMVKYQTVGVLFPSSFSVRNVDCIYK